MNLASVKSIQRNFGNTAPCKQIKPGQDQRGEDGGLSTLLVSDLYPALKEERKSSYLCDCVSLVTILNSQQ